MEIVKDPFLFSDQQEKLQFDRIHHFLSTKSYWSQGISFDVVRKSAQNSLSFGIYDLRDQKQIAFGRVITDRTSFAWLCDVYVEDEYRGLGLSKWIMENLLLHPELQGLRSFCLATKDAHSLYEKFGFKTLTDPSLIMMKK